MIHPASSANARSPSFLKFSANLPSRRPQLLCMILLCTALEGCGTAGLLSALGGSGGSSTSVSTPVISGMSVTLTRTTPALIEFRLVDPQSKRFDIELTFKSRQRDQTGCEDQGSLEGFPYQQVRLIEGPDPENPAATLTTKVIQLPSAPGDGKNHRKLWAFDAPDQLGSEMHTPFVELEVRILPDGPTTSIKTQLGNDPPRLFMDPSDPNQMIAPEVEGIANIVFTLTDSSEDIISLTAQYDLLDDNEPNNFVDATSAGGLPPALLPSSCEGRKLNYFWDVVADLGLAEHPIRFRLIPKDENIEGNTVLIDFQIDNNTPPNAAIDISSFLSGTDSRRGIPVAFRSTDGKTDDDGIGIEDGDDVLVVFQQAARVIDFRSLDGISRTEMEAILEDPALRKEFQIATELPLRFSGILTPDPLDRTDAVRLQELATSAAGLVEGVPDPDAGFFSRVQGTLEVHRPSSVPFPLSERWTKKPKLQSPIAILPLGRGIQGLVLENLGTTWRLRVLDLGNGEILETITESQEGSPRAMTFEQGESSVLVAATSADGMSSRFFRVSLKDKNSGTVEFLGSLESNESVPVRGLVNLGTEASLVTVASSLVRLDYSDNASFSTTVLLGPEKGTPLQAPWGIVVDPVIPNLIFLAENGANRILEVHLDTLETIELDARAPTNLPPPALPGPQSLALERSGTRLLVITDVNGNDETLQLRAVETRGGNREVFQIFPGPGGGAGYPGPIGSLETGGNGLRVLTLTMASDLAAGGGVEQRREIRQTEAGNYDASRQVVSLEKSLDPLPTPGQTWKVEKNIRLVRSEPVGTTRTFLWDSRDIPSGGPVFFRVTPFDSDRGIGNDAGPRMIRAPADSDPVVLGDDPVARSLGKPDVADLDKDGDLDIISVGLMNGRATYTIFRRQENLGRLVFREDNVDVPALSTPACVRVGDLVPDPMGQLDFVVADSTNDNLVVFQQSIDLSFSPVQVLGDSTTTNGVRSVVPADIDGDRDLDLVSANQEADTLTIFIQENGTYLPDPTVLFVGSNTSPVDVAAADLNGDGRLDLVSANQDTRDLRLFLQEPGGGFSGITQTLTPGGTGNVAAVTIADLDQDGDLDLVSANPGGNLDNLTIFFQVLPGEFDPTPLVLGGTPFNPGPQSVAAADFDGDGDLDLVSADVTFPDGNELNLYLQTEPGKFDTTSTIVNENLSNPRSVTTADVDGDGSPDIITSGLVNPDSGVPSRVLVFRQETTPSFVFQTSIVGGPAFTDDISDVAANDIDNDGDFDLISANQTTNDLSVFLQTGPREFTFTNTLKTGDANGPSPQGILPGSVSLADLDGDGNLDVVSANGGNGNIEGNLTIFFQIAPGEFNPEPVRLTGATGSGEGKGQPSFFPQYVEAHDVSGDGRLDLIAANQGFTGGNPGNIAIFYQVEDGSFEPAPQLLTGDFVEPTGLAVGDLDLDGRADIVSANRRSNNVGVFRQTSQGTFALELLPLAPNARPRRVVLADLDENGRSDIVVASDRNGRLSYFLQSRNGKLVPQEDLISGSADFFAVAVGDIDHDGDLDIAGAAEPDGSRSGNIIIFLQTSPGSFDPLPRIFLDAGSLIQSPRSLDLIDLDGDSDLDVLSAFQRSCNLAVFYE